jgi:hypothetical protein
VAREPCGVDLPAGRQDAQGDRQVEAARILRQVRRSQIHRDPLVVREFETRVLDGRSHALARLPDFHIDQAD